MNTHRDEDLRAANSATVIRRILLAAAAITAATVGVSAHASCADPRLPTQQSTKEQADRLDLLLAPSSSEFAWKDAGERIVGTWHVVYTPDGSTTPSGEAFIQWHSDGTEWENINYPVLGGNICMGSWKIIDQRHVSRNHYGWLFDNGILAGYFNETETDEVAADGSSYSGTNTTTLYFSSGPPVVLTGTATAKRISP
jgi:hypothetical protein